MSVGESPVVLGQRLVDGALVRVRALTPEQRLLRVAVARRAALIQAGVRQPASGVFGRVKAPKS